MKKIILYLSCVLAAFALFVTTINVNSTCFMVLHQPVVPDEAKRLYTVNCP